MLCWIDVILFTTTKHVTFVFLGDIFPSGILNHIIIPTFKYCMLLWASPKQGHYLVSTYLIQTIRYERSQTSNSRIFRH